MIPDLSMLLTLAAPAWRWAPTALEVKETDGRVWVTLKGGFIEAQRAVAK